MSISITNNFANAVSKTVQSIENPNHPWGVLVEEIPSDVGRTYQSYKRGGVLEGLERFTRETLSASVWLFGIPIFNKLGNFFFENIKHVPVDMDYENQTIENVVDYLKNGINPKNKDTAELQKYLSSGFVLKDCDKNELIKNIKKYKAISTVGAVLLNCLMMGVVIPKFNQFLTKKRLNKMDKNKTTLKTPSMDEFQKKTSKEQPSFKGLGSMAQNAKNLASLFPYAVENNNTFRLVVTDAPTLLGRTSTSRNKYEALENLVIDGGSIYFYNFCAHNLRDFLCSKTKVPVINPMVSKLFLEADKDIIQSAMDKIQGGKQLSVDKIFDKQTADKIYDLSTFGKYSKLNRYVRPKDIDIIDNQVYNYLCSLSKKLDYSKSKDLDIKKFRELTKSYNVKSAGLLALGFATAIWGLSTFLPKLAFKITTLLTGKNEFTGIANFDNKEEKTNKNIK